MHLRRRPNDVCWCGVVRALHKPGVGHCKGFRFNRRSNRCLEVYRSYRQTLPASRWTILRSRTSDTYWRVRAWWYKCGVKQRSKERHRLAAEIERLRQRLYDLERVDQ